jgi:hypothetical protein
MIGRITNGGFNMRSRPLLVAATGVGLGDSGVGLSLGDGDTSGDGDGDASGVAVGAGACRSKLAHGLGGTLAHRW